MCARNKPVALSGSDSRYWLFQVHADAGDEEPEHEPCERTVIRLLVELLSGLCSW